MHSSGVELRYQDARTKAYLGSPALTRLPDGTLLAAHDYFGPGCARNHEDEEHLTTVYRSEDGGETWQEVNHIAGAFWSSLFCIGDAVYLIGTSQQYGSIVIRRSTDGGWTWTHPADEQTGLLVRGGPYREPPNFHCAPVPVLEHEGRIYRAFEDNTPCHWPTGFQSLVLSAPVDADLLDARSWRMSNRLPYRPEWTPKDWSPLPEQPGWLEGNVVLTPDGELWNILRFNSKPEVDKAAIVRIHDEGRRITFDPDAGFIDFPGGMSKFTIRRDPQTGFYLTLSNPNTDRRFPNQRNVLALCWSEDLLRWTVGPTLLQDDSDLPWEESVRLTGFQYVDWLFDGDDILYFVRTAWNGAHNFHDANRMVFHRLKNFRAFLPPRSAASDAPAHAPQ